MNNTSNTGYIIIWAYDVLDEYCQSFEQAYSADGDWAQLFRQSEDYLGTKLYRDETQSNRYITLDYWTSASAYHDFIQQKQSDYQVLDKKFEAWTVNETLIGKFTDSSFPRFA